MIREGEKREGTRQRDLELKLKFGGSNLKQKLGADDGVQLGAVVGVCTFKLVLTLWLGLNLLELVELEVTGAEVGVGAGLEAWWW